MSHVEKVPRGADEREAPARDSGMLPASMDAAPTATALPAQPGLGPRALRTQAFRAAVELCRARLAASSSGRFARVTAILIAVGAFAIALSLRMNDGPAAPVGGLLRKGAGAIAWIAGGALALAAARSAEAADREDGIEALVASRGISAALLGAARTLGATSHIGWTIGLPSALLGLATAGLAPDVPSALRRVAAAFALLAWGAIVGVTLGALAAASARLFRRRGPTVLAAFVLGERLLADAVGLGAWSVPGALQAALSLLLGATGVGGGR
jgi:hypothetical protein